MISCKQQEQAARQIQHPVPQQPDLSKVASKNVREGLVAVVPIAKSALERASAEAEKFGSGIVVSDKGYILTTSHVASKASEFQIEFGEDKK